MRVLIALLISVGLLFSLQNCTGKRCEDCGTVVRKTILEGINFDTDKANLLPIAYPILDKDITVLKNSPDLVVSIEGHCDIRGGDMYNQKLSERRANTVFNYFFSKGIDRSRMYTKGYGRSRPLVPNTTSENMYKNRRVEIKIIKLDE